MKNIVFLGYLLKKKRFCIPNYSIRELLVHKAHESELMRHFWVAKT